MKKKILSIFTMLCIMLSVVGCGSDSTGKGKINEAVTVGGITITVGDDIRHGDDWMTVPTKIENNSKEEIDIWWSSGTLVYADGYEYTSDWLTGVYTSSSGITKHDMEHVSVKPLESTTYRFAFDVADGVPTDDKPLKLKLSFKGNKFEFDLR